MHQLSVWKHALEPVHQQLPLEEFGYKHCENNVGIRPKLMNQSFAAPELLNDLTCECNTCTESCSCYINQQPYTNACSCTANTNNEDMVCLNVYTLSLIFAGDSDSFDSEN